MYALFKVKKRKTREQNRAENAVTLMFDTSNIIVHWRFVISNLKGRSSVKYLWDFVFFIFGR